MNRTFLPIALALLLLPLGIDATAAPGDFDTRYGVAGLVSLPDGTSGSLALDDGQLLVFGPSPAGSGSPRIRIRRLLPDGQADASFGTLGESSMDPSALLSARGLTGCNSSLGDVVAAPDGAPTGTLYSSCFTDSINIAFKMLPNGAMDPAFGTGGLVRVPDPPNFTGPIFYESVFPIGLRADGAVLLGLVHDWDFGSALTGLRWLRADGSWAQDIGVPGSANDLFTFAHGTLGLARLRSDGKVALFGTGGSVCFNADGTVDRSYGNNGSVDFAAGSALNATVLASGLLAGNPTAFVARDAVIGSDGRITMLVVGNNSTSGKLLVLRLTAGGQLDSSFGSGGIAALDSRGTPWDGLAASEWGGLRLRVASTGQVTLLGDINLVAPGTATGIFSFIWRLDANGQPPAEPALRGVQLLATEESAATALPPLELLGTQTGYDILLKANFNRVLRLSGTAPASAGMLTLSGASTADEGKSLRIPIFRTAGVSGAIHLTYATNPMNVFAAATPGSDYTTTSGSLDWADGESGVKYITVPVLSDSLAEPDERFAVDIVSVTGGVSLLGSATQITAVITANTAPSPAPTPAPAPVPTPSAGATGGGGALDHSSLLLLGLALCLAGRGRRLARAELADTSGARPGLDLQGPAKIVLMRALPQIPLSCSAAEGVGEASRLPAAGLK